MVSSSIGGLANDKSGNLTKFGKSGYYKALTIAAAGASGGISSSIAGGDFWKGARQGIITAGLNHLAHRVMEFRNKPQGNSEPWDLNGDGILQKTEADLWGVRGKGQAITVDNSKIDWTGLEIPEGYKDGQRFAISTTKAFLKLPYETAATYGGTAFKIISIEQGIVEVQNQSYHYEMRPNNNGENILRNIATKIGFPTTMTLYNGKFHPYMIQYKNRSIKLK